MDVTNAGIRSNADLAARSYFLEAQCSNDILFSSICRRASHAGAEKWSRPFVRTNAYTSKKSPSFGSVAGCCYASTARRDGGKPRRSIMSKQKTASGSSSNSRRSIRATRSAGHQKFSIRLITTNLGRSNGTEGGSPGWSSTSPISPHQELPYRKCKALATWHGLPATRNVCGQFIVLCRNLNL